MNTGIRSSSMFFAVILLLCTSATAQVDEICAEFGSTPSLNSPFAQIPYVYGRIVLKGYDTGGKFPRITVILVDPQQSQKRLTVEKSANYCFRRSSGSGGTLVIDVDGVEVDRRSISSFGATQQREDFEIHMAQSQRPGKPGTVSAKFSHPQNEKTVELYIQAAEAETAKNLKQAIGYLKEIVSLDAADFIAWAKLGSLYLEQKSLAEAEAAFRKSIELKLEYTPAWVNVGKIRIAQKQFEGAVEIFKHATTLEPTSARTFQLLGEAALQARQGTLGVEALNQAIKLDPIGMAECHLQLAHLYQLAGAKQLAAKEYKIFLEKTPEHPEKKKFEKFIKDNP